MTELEYFHTLTEEYIQALIKFKREYKSEPGEFRAMCKRWNKKPAALLNDLTLMKTARANKWLKSSP